MATGFRSLGLHDPAQALGLPTGSIRALIALTLIMMFIALSVHLYNDQRRGGDGVTLTGLTTEQVSTFRSPMRVERASDGTYTIHTRPEVPAASERVAQQLLTTIGTLVVAVASFYFGSATATAGGGRGGEGGTASGAQETERPR